MVRNYTTSIEEMKSIMEIQKMLTKHKAKSFITNNDDDLIPCGLSFTMPFENRLQLFALPVDYAMTWRKLRQESISGKYKTKEQAIRTAWRNMRDRIALFLSEVEETENTVEEVFFRYLVAKDGTTAYEFFKNNQQLLKAPNP